MQYLHLTCSWACLHDLVDTFTQQFAGRAEVAVLDYGVSPKAVQGYLVLGWDGDIEDAFIDHLVARPEILDLSIFTLPCSASLDNFPACRCVRRTRCV